MTLNISMVYITPIKKPVTKKEVTQLSYEITGCAIKVHKVLGPGLLESVYQRCLEYELSRNHFTVIRQVLVPVVYENIAIDADLRLDLLVNNCVVVELKAVEHLLPVCKYPLFQTAIS
ncbi:GxxExxY protein [Niabella sp. CC-SYL272]|uniref:GxxExxY protein n=1 Tax=Niabella agricola TaxID=2891571 RepID=UPI001F1C8C10|nr:GxxExxY protein [Niabella agricola]MCF3110787.1 GxxExxY protein [Niabella agricola]